jgi:hypothetical protein
MAFTKSQVLNTVIGNQRLIVYDITADAAAGAVTTDLDTVVGVWSQGKSMASAPYSIKADELTAGTASAGSIGITGVTSGDLIQVFCLGR